MSDKEKIRIITEELLADTDKFLVDILIQPVNRISVFVDGDHGITIEDCRRISRSLEEKLLPDQEDFELNVSSPGLDRPIKLLRQYQKNIGRNLEITKVDNEKMDGTLLRVDESGIEISTSVKKRKNQEENQTIILPYKEIKTAKIKIDFRK
jgi:ribosome maturation factor RimP